MFIIILIPLNSRSAFYWAELVLVLVLVLHSLAHLVLTVNKPKALASPEANGCGTRSQLRRETHFKSRHRAQLLSLFC